MSDCKGCKYWTQAINDYANGKHTDDEPNPFCSTCEGDKYQPKGAKETKASQSAKIAVQVAEIEALKAKVAELEADNARMREALGKIDTINMKNPYPDRPWKWCIMDKVWQEHAEMKRIAKQSLLKGEG